MKKLMKALLIKEFNCGSVVIIGKHDWFPVRVESSYVVVGEWMFGNGRRIEFADPDFIKKMREIVGDTKILIA